MMVPGFKKELCAALPVQGSKCHHVYKLNMFAVLTCEHMQAMS